VTPARTNRRPAALPGETSLAAPLSRVARRRLRARRSGGPLRRARNGRRGGDPGARADRRPARFGPARRRLRGFRRAAPTTDRRLRRRRSGRRRARRQAAASAIDAALPPAARRYFLLLFDLSNSEPSAIVRARRAAQQLVAESLLPTDLVGVATWSLSRGATLQLAFTSDREQVEMALETLGIASERVRPDPLGILLADIERSVPGSTPPPARRRGRRRRGRSGCALPGRPAATRGEGAIDAARSACQRGHGLQPRHRVAGAHPGQYPGPQAGRVALARLRRRAAARRR
jgi:hypothetical protein